MSGTTNGATTPAAIVCGGGRGSNVSVTNINCDNDQPTPPAPAVLSTSSAATPMTSTSSGNFFANGAVRISVPKMEESEEESDSELTSIEKGASSVALRVATKNGPRPMSWEGLSETEDVSMDTEKPDAKPSLDQPVDFSEARKTIKPELVSPENGNGASGGGGSGGVTFRKLETLKHEQVSDGSALASPLLEKAKAANFLPANPSPDSAIHSVYTHSSPSQSPLTSRHAPYTPTLSRNNSDASYSSCYSYSSEFSPTHSPIQGRHPIYGSSASLHHSLYKPIFDGEPKEEGGGAGTLDGEALPTAGISRQQLINSPCPICGDKISGFHYGIFSCESCKGFFKRTVQNRKNYVCLRGASCPVTIATRKKCPACRFDKCLQKGMKLEAIREDRTRGGRSTYQCSYTLPGSLLSPSMSGEAAVLQHSGQRILANGPHHFKLEPQDLGSSSSSSCNGAASMPGVPSLLQEIMDVEHLWQYNDAELSRLNQPPKDGNTSSLTTNPLLASAGLNGDNSNPEMIVTLCNIADHRLYKIVKWCKSLPLFKNISIDDQICLLINSWCELLLFSCCFRSVATPGQIRISLGKSISLAEAKSTGLQACIERMLNLTDHLRRLRVDRYEYVAMKVIVLLSSDTSELKEPEKVRASQEKALNALQTYTLAHYPDSPAKFGQLMLRIPELQRTCQLGKEMLTFKSKDGEEPSFNLLMELLRGEH